MSSVVWYNFALAAYNLRIREPESLPDALNLIIYEQKEALKEREIAACENKEKV